MHVTKKVGLAAIAAASLIAISLPFAVVAGAQSSADQQGDLQRAQGGQGGQGGFGQGGQGGQGGFGQGAIPAPGQGGQGGRGGFGGGGQGFPGGMGGGGASAMESDNMFLYVLQGNTIFKIGKADLKIISQANLMPMGAPGQPGQPGFGGRGGNGGGGQGGNGE